MGSQDVFRLLQDDRKSIATLEKGIEVILMDGEFSFHQENNNVDWVKLGIETRPCSTHIFYKNHELYLLSDISLKRILNMSIYVYQEQDAYFRNQKEYIVSETTKEMEIMRLYINNLSVKSHRDEILKTLPA